MFGLRRLYDWMLALSQGRHAEKALAGVSFCCSIFFPIPQDVMLVPMCLSNPSRSFRYALIAVLASVLGGFVAYLLGAFLYERIAVPILEFYGVGDAGLLFRDYYARYGWFLVLVGGLTPLPYKVIALLSGSLGLFLPIFILASFVGRFIRFFGIALFLYLFGTRFKKLIDEYFNYFCWFLLLLMVLGFYILAFIL